MGFDSRYKQSCLHYAGNLSNTGFLCPLCLCGENTPDFSLPPLPPTHYALPLNDVCQGQGGDGVQEALGVGGLWVVEDSIHIAPFDDFSLLHYANIVGEIFYDGKIVSDKKVRQAVLTLQFPQKV